MKLSDFDYELPKELIAQVPVEPRNHSRLMVVDRVNQLIKNDYFYNLFRYLDPTDLLVFNDTKVIPVRLKGVKKSGGKVEILLLKLKNSKTQKIETTEWEFIGKNIGRSRELVFDGGLTGMFVDDGVIILNKNYADLVDYLNEFGYTPLPPYIGKNMGEKDPKTRQSYQTVYAREIGSAAAPTAGFHFTDEMMAAIANKAFVTLHVGLGTFLPVKSERIEEHKMHEERYEIKNSTTQKIKNSKQNGNKIVAVGTTSVRTLESWGQTGKTAGETEIFIYPGYRFKVVDKMITNFHLPKSTLLMLVSAFAGQDLIRRAYQEAVAQKYRFFSFGDAMLIV